MQTGSDKNQIPHKARIFRALIISFCLLIAPFSAFSNYAAIVINADTGDIVSETNANQLWFPASLTKVMTLYLTFKALNANQIKLQDRLIISKKASRQPKVRLGLKQGKKVSVEQAILAVATRSANDAALLLAEHLAKTESIFAVRMTKQARLLGMNNTVFLNSTGLPNDKQVTTARDMAVLAQAILRDFPEYYKYFSTPSFSYNKKLHFNINRILKVYTGADGIKTGFTCGSGYNLMASAKRKGKRLIAILMGAKNGQLRTKQMVKLLDNAFKKTQATVAKKVAQAQPKSLKPALVQLSSAQCYKAFAKSSLKNKVSKWTVIFGAFVNKKMAKDLIKKIKPNMGVYVKYGRPVVIKRMMNGVQLWHALWSGLKQEQAGKTCKTLWSVDEYCRVLHPSVFSKVNTQWN